jgi:hypothetical protein
LLRRFLPLALLAIASISCAQQSDSTVTGSAAINAILEASSSLPDAPDALLAQQSSAKQVSGPAKSTTPPPQPTRILGLMPNYRAVSAGVKPPPATPKQAFLIATKQSFDYSSFVFVGLTSAIAEGEDSHPKLGKGIPGFWAYSWRGYVDKTDGNYWVVFILPTILHEDERYYALGRGPILKRLGYAVSRIVITPDYHGHPTINGAELLGRGIAQGIGTTYYPTTDNTAGALAQKYAYALLRDAATNAFREVWPDIATHLQHHHNTAQP